MKQRTLAYYLSTLVLATTLLVGNANADRNTEARKSVLSSSILRQDVVYLASEKLQGRGSGTRGNEMAAKYIAETFAKHGLKPVGVRGQRSPDASNFGTGYYQPFRIVTGRAVGRASKLVANVGGKSYRYRMNQDYEPSGISAGGAAEGDLVFVGFGIRAPQANHDDYAGLDIKGKIVLLLAGNPKDDPHSPLAEFASIRRKALMAREAGAVAVLVVSPKQSDTPASSVSDFSNASDAGIPVLRVKYTVVESWFDKDQGRNLAATLATANDGKSVSAPMGVKLTLNADVKKVEKITANVIGLLEGSDPTLKDEYVVIGAHLDHLGMGGTGSLHASSEPAIHYGADDNASGTAGILGMVRYFTQENAPRPKRSILFMGFSGEEMGLLGSDHYVKNPLRPIEKTVAMINMDMVGRLRDNRLIVTGSGTAKEWDVLLNEANRTAGFQLARSEDGFGASDQQSFYLKNIPVLFFFTGTHDDYHKPTDTSEKINYDGLTKILGLVADCADWIANTPARPTYQQVAAATPTRNTGFRVYFGSVPDYAAGVEGVQLSGVREGSPAGKAGLKIGDIIIKFGGINIKSVQDYTLALGNFKPGDEIEIVIKRGNETLTLKATLVARREG